MDIIDFMDKVKNGEITPEDIDRNGWGGSVTARIKFIKQPRGGYIKPKEFERIQLEGGGIEDLPHPMAEENVHVSLVGMAVDYLTRFITGDKPEAAFGISYLGARTLKKLDTFEDLLSRITGLDDKSIDAAVKLTGFDCVYRAGKEVYRPVEDIIPNSQTIENIRAMVTRAQNFFKLYGPKVRDSFTFEGGTTPYITVGDGDYLTQDGLWDFKVSKRDQLTSDQTLQLLIYWRMGLHSIFAYYYFVQYLGIYNPRTNVAYRLKVDKIPQPTIDEVEEKVIGYEPEHKTRKKRQ